MRNNRSSLLVIALFGAIALAGCSKSDNSKNANTASDVTLTADQQKHIQLYTVVRSTYHKTIEATGVVDFDNDQATSVLAPFSGPVSQLLVSPGDQVKQGDALARVDSPDFAAAISAYRKAAAEAQSARRLANLDRDLLKHQGVAQKEADQAEADAESAEADRDAALQALVSLGVDPQTIDAVRRGRIVARSPGVIRAPIAGTVVEKLITPGQLLQAGTTACFTVANLSRVWVMTQVFGADLDSVSVGDTAQIMTGIDSRTLSGRVDNIAAQVDPDTRSVEVRVVADNPDDFLKKQMYVNVRIVSHRASTGLLVPVSAILRDDENLPFVYVTQRDGGFARRHVTVGYRSGDSYDIPSGLHAGDRVVADGALFIQFMQSQ